MFYVIYPELWKFLIKMTILELASKEAAAPLMSVAAPLRFCKFWKKIYFLEFFSKILKLWKFWFKISKVGIKFWRWEGYMYSKMSLRTSNSGGRLDVSNVPTICNDRSTDLIYQKGRRPEKLGCGRGSKNNRVTKKLSFIELSFADSVPFLLQAVHVLKSISLVVFY